MIDMGYNSDISNLMHACFLNFVQK